MRTSMHLLIGIILFAFLTNFSSLAQSQSQSAVSQDSKFHVYLLLGQSNMAGRGEPEQEDLQTHSRVQMLTKTNEWVLAQNPLHFDKPSAAVGPGLSFGMLMADEDSGVTIGLVPSAAGGSSINAWKAGGYHDQTKSYPYDDAMKRAKIAMQAGQLNGIIWHQGESDSKPGQAEQYAQKLAELISNIRKELNAPKVPFVVATLADFYVTRTPSAVQINQALQNLPKQVQYTACVTTADLTHKGDTLHFDAASARELGSRYAKAMQQLQKKKSKK